MLPHNPPWHEQLLDSVHLGCHSCKSKATNRRVWSREQLYLSESKMISLIRISYSFRFIVRRSVSTDSYDRLDFTNFRIRYCTFLLLNKIMAILGCLIASFFLCTIYRNGSWLHHSKILWSLISDKLKKKNE